MRSLFRSIASRLPAIVALAFALPTLFYPMSWDTSVHYYVGREWALRGALPYRDSFDHKTPGIHAIHAILVTLLGQGMWQIRAFEIVCIAVMSICAARIISRGERGRAKIFGLTALAMSVTFFGAFDHWSTAQPEIACATLVTLSLALSMGGVDRWRGAGLSGLATGAALLVKPTAIFFLVIIAVDLFIQARARRRAWHALLRFALGASALPALMLAYFACHGALGSLHESLVGANAIYVTEESRAKSLAEILDHARGMNRAFAPFSWAFVAWLGVAPLRLLSRPSRVSRAHRIALGLAIAAVLGVVVQMKFYLYHAAILACPASLAFALLFRATLRHVSAWISSANVRPAMTLAVMVVVAAAYALFSPASDFYARNALLTARFVAGAVPRETFVARFEPTEGRRPFSVMDRIGRYIAARTTPSDRILVRGVSAEIYVVSERAAASRFFWSAFLTDKTRSYRRDAWLAEDLADIRANNPRYVVCRAVEQGASGEAYFLALGYEVETRIEGYTILTRK